MRRKQNTSGAVIRAADATASIAPAERIERIRQMQEAITKAQIGIAMLAMAIGDELNAEKDSRPHGTFLPWLESSMAQMGIKSARTANEYMRLSKHRSDVELVLEQNADASLREAFRALGRTSTPSADENATTATDGGKELKPEPPPINPRSRRAFAINHVPDDLRVTPERLRTILDWYESDDLMAAYRQANGTASKSKPRRKVARVSAVVKPKAKRDLERAAKRHDMTQGELIEQLLTFADRVKTMNRRGGDK